MGPNGARARAAYEAYCLATGGRSFDGHNLATWEDLPARVQAAWRQAAIAAVRFTLPAEGTKATPHETDERHGHVTRFDESADDD